jgi:hypothetical protein
VLVRVIVVASHARRPLLASVLGGVVLWQTGILWVRLLDMKRQRSSPDSGRPGGSRDSGGTRNRVRLTALQPAQADPVKRAAPSPI